MNKLMLFSVVAMAVIAGGCGKMEKTAELPAPKSDYVSPEFVAVSKRDSSVFVSGATSQCIINVSPDGAAMRMWRVESAFAENLPLNPTGIAAANDGGVYVTCGVQCGELQKYSYTGERKGAVKVGHSPVSPVITANGKMAYVLNRFANKVSVVDLDSMRITGTIPVLREPFAAALGVNEKYLFVANMLPYCAATNNIVAAAVSVIDVKTHKTKHILLANGSTGVRGLCASPDGKSIYVTHTMGRFQLPTTQLERGWMNTAALSVFDGETGEYINTVLLDDSNRGAANPWGVAVTADGKQLIVAHAGTGEISVIDRTKLHERLAKAKKGKSDTGGIIKSAEDVSYDLSFLVSIRTRHLIGGNGPRGIALVGNNVVTAIYFEDAVSFFDLENPSVPARVVRVGSEKDLSKDRVRRGEMLYNDGSMCFQQWQSCASCHPDGRVDALNWDLLNDGVGNPKQTKTQLYCGFTPPTMISGIRKDMHECNMAGLIHIQFVTRPEEDVYCFDAYCDSMKPVPSPYLVNGKLSQSAKRGKKLFDKAKCNTCHTPDKKTPTGEPLWTDLLKYDVGVGKDTEKGKMFDTPTLAECWRTAPYLYDGRALTMEEVLTTCNKDDLHGETSKMTAEEIKDLAEYVLSL